MMYWTASLLADTIETRSGVGLTGEALISNCIAPLFILGERGFHRFHKFENER